MLKKILVATDFSHQSEVALAQAIAIGERVGGELIVLWVEGAVSKAPSGAAIYGSAVTEVDRLVTSLRAESAAKLNAMVDRANARGVSANVRIEQGHPDEVIVATGAEISADLIVTGTKGLTGVKRFFLGSVAEKVMRMSETNVLVARGDERPYQRILVPVDFSPASEKALDLAIAIAGPDTAIDVLHAWQYPPGTQGLTTPDPPPGPLADLRTQLVEASQAQGRRMIERRGDANLQLVQAFGAAASVIQDRLDAESYDLVAMGTHGYRGFRRFLLGSVAEATLRHSPCSVLVAHAEHSANDAS